MSANNTSYTHRISLLVAVSGLMVFGGAAATHTFAQSPASQTADQVPGAVGAVSGHVPDQHEQAAAARTIPSASGVPRRLWWGPGEARPLPAFEEYENEFGRVGIFNADGPVTAAGHPFFEPIGENGRACISCHQPSDAMSLSVASIQQRWEDTDGKDPIFAPVDGMNCPNLPVGDPNSYSLLLQRGLFRIFLPWPPKAADGTSIDPEFTIEVVNDPTGCNTDAEFGLASENPMISVFRRPRVMANMHYILSGGGLFNIKDGSPMAKDPDTGRPVSMQLMADGREPTLRTQATEAAITHLQHLTRLSSAQLDQLEAFQRQIYVAQSFSKDGGDLATWMPTVLGARALQQGKFGLGDSFKSPLFGDPQAWREPRPGESAAQREFRNSVARGYDVFFVRPFWIRDVTHLNSVGLGNPIKRTCATCHNGSMIGNDIAPGWMDLGTTNFPWAATAHAASEVRAPFAHAFDQPLHSQRSALELGRASELPVFKLTCRPEARPHPYLGRVIYTSDPGRALITGRCSDIGSITIQQLRGLPARAPFFVNGSARTLRELVDYYDLRFDARYSEQEKQDLVNFLSVL